MTTIQPNSAFQPSLQALASPTAQPPFERPEAQSEFSVLDTRDLLATSTVEAAAKPPDPLQIKIYTTYGTHQEVTLKGRVLDNEGLKPGQPSDSKLKNLIRNLTFLDSDEARKAWVEISFAGQTVRAQTDRDGLFEVKVKPPHALKAGFHPVSARLVPGQDLPPAPEAQGQVIIQDAKDTGLGVVSDIDDTVQYTHVTDKWKALKTLLFGNETTLQQVPGMASLYQALEDQDGQADGDISYLSGSPINFSERIDTFLEQNGFPKGPVQLKNMGFRKGEDHPLKQGDYKIKHLRELFETFPQKSFVLFGDSGEKDPEIYRTLQQEYPGRVKGIYIHHVSDEAATHKRFEGMVVLKNGLAAAQDLHQKGLISAEALGKVQEAVVKAALP